MAVEITITDRKVYNQYGNGLNYGINPTEFATYLRGGVMGVQKAVYTVNVDWRDGFDINDGQRWEVNGNLLIRFSGDWILEGFSIGDTIDLQLDTGGGLITIFTNRVITNITKDKIYFDGAAIAPQSSETEGNLLGGKTDLFGLEYSFGIVDNNAVDEYRSLLDNSDQTYYADNIGLDLGAGRVTTFTEMQPKSDYNLGWVTTRAGKTQVRFVGRPSTYVQQFEIEHEYIINPYNDESLLDENKSFKYISKFDFRTVLNNINTSKTQIDDLQLGAVGFFNENYDGYNNDFSISNLVYTDVASGSTATELNLKSKTRVEFTVNSTDGLFNINDPLIALHSYIPEFNDYNKSSNDFRDTWLFESVRTNIDGAFNIQGIFTKFESTFVSANEITCLIEIEFGALDIEEGDNYILAIEVGDGNTAVQSKNVTLQIDINTYVSDNNITDLIISNEFGFNPYYKFIAPTADLFTTYYGWVEDEIVSYHRFGVNRSAAKDAQILKGTFKIVAYEDATGETFDLQSEELDLSGQLTAPPNTVNSNPFDIQLIEDERTRGYRLPAGDEFNLLLWETDDNDGTYQYYEWRVGFKMNWQYWIALPGADSVFIDTSDTFNGLNNRASNYSLKNGWSIRTQWQFDMQGLDDDGNVGETEYNFYTDQHSIFDFDEQDNDPTIWTCEIFTYDESSNDLGGAILSNEYTFIKAIFTPTSPYVIVDITPYWAEIRIAEENQQGFINDVLSTTKSYLDDNKLIPLEAETYAKISLVSNTIEVDCRVDFNELKDNTNYKLSARLANQDEPIPIVEWIFSTESNPPSDTFDPSVVTSGGELPTWELIEGTQYVGTTSVSQTDRTTTAALTLNELNGTCQDVVVTFSTNDPSNIDEINIAADEICDNVDLSIFENLNTIYLHLNSNLTSITQPSVQTAELTTFWAHSSGLIGNLDFSNVANLSGDFRVYSNGGLTGITFASSITSSNQLSKLYAYSCGLTGNLDLSMFDKIGGEIRLQSNGSLTGLSFTTTPDVTAGNITTFFAYSCGLIGNLDVSNLKIGGQFRTENNASLTSITFSKIGTNNLTLLRIRNSGLTGTQDISQLTNLSGTINIEDCSSLTNITYPATTNGNVSITAFNCGLTGVHDFSNITKIGGTINFENNSLTGFTFAATPDAASANISTLNFSNNSITGVLDLSMLDKIGGNIQLDTNSSMTSVTFTSTLDAGALTITNLYLNSCGLTGTQNISGLTNLGGIVRFNANVGLTSITYPASTATISELNLEGCSLGHDSMLNLSFVSSATINFQNNNMTTGEVDNYLSDLNTILGLGSGNIFIGGSNAAPTSTAPGSDYDDLVVKGWTIS